MATCYNIFNRSHRRFNSREHEHSLEPTRAVMDVLDSAAAVRVEGLECKAVVAAGGQDTDSDG